MKMLAYLAVAVVVLATLANAGPFFSFSGGNVGVSYTLDGPAGIKSAQGLTSLGGEIGYNYSHLVVGMTYNYMFQRPGQGQEWSRNVCEGPISKGLKDVRVSTFGLRLGFNTAPHSPTQVIVSATTDKTSAKLYYPGFNTPVSDGAILGGVETEFVISFTPSFYSFKQSQHSSKRRKSSVGVAFFIKGKFIAPFGKFVSRLNSLEIDPDLSLRKDEPSGYQFNGGLQFDF